MRPNTQLYSDVFNASPIGIVVENFDGQPLFVNPAFCSMLGFNEDELRSKHCVDFSPAEDAQKDWALFQQLRAGSIDQYQIEKRYFRRDGSLVWGRLSVSLLKNNPSPLVIAMVEDITEKKTAEEARFRHAAIVESSQDAIISKNLDAVITSWNAVAERMFGYTEAEAVGQPITILIPPELRDEESKILERLRAGGRIDRYETIRVTKTGKYVDVSLAISPIKDLSGKLVGFSKIAHDITERKREKEALRQSEMRYRKIVETTSEGVWLVNSTLHNSYVNRQMAEMLGYEPEEMLGRSVFDFYFPEDVEGKKQVLMRRRQGLREQIEERLRRKDGSELWVRLAGTPVFNDNGEFDGALAMISDITERKRAEEAVKESEQRFGLIANTAPVLIWMSGTDKLCTYVNTAWLNLTGRSMHSQLGNGWAEGVHSEDLQRCINTYTHFFDRREQFQMEYRVRRHDGEYRWILDTGVPRFNQDRSFAGYIGIAVDVTDRKTAEAALLRLNWTLEGQTALLQTRDELLRIFVKHVPVAVAMLDRDMRYLQVSERWCADFGLSSTEFLGRSHYEIFPDIPDRWKQLHRRALEGETLRAEEDRWDRQGGTTWLRWEIRPWQSLDGLPGGILIFSEDITRRKQIDEALAEFPRKLIEAQEQERIRIGRELHDDICQRLAMLAIELQQVHENSLILPEVRSRIGDLQQQTSEIADDIQSLSHELHSAKLQYLGIAAAMRGFCRKFGEQQKVEIDFQTHDMPSPLSADTSLCFFRVLQESLHNASKHSGVQHFEVRLWGTSDEIHLTVKDSGKGFDQEAAKTSPGLGLISMDERVKMVNGTLTIESHSKGGTTIHARVPLGSGRNSMRAAG
jgi:PAS domain S-box-containing protein